MGSKMVVEKRVARQEAENTTPGSLSICRATRVMAVRRNVSVVELECATDSLSLAYITFSFPSVDVVRWTVSLDGYSLPDTPLLRQETGWKSVKASIRDTDDQIELRTSKLCVLITKNPWSFSVRDLDGKLLLEDAFKNTTIGLDRQSETLAFQLDAAAKAKSVHTSLRLFPSEEIYGLGERFNDFSKRGQRVSTRNVDTMSGTTNAAYKNIPFCMSTRGYGIYVNTLYNTDWDIGVASPNAIIFSVDEPILDVFFFVGPRLSHVLERFTELTGKPFQPPKWFFGFWISRFSYATQTQVEDVCAKMRMHHVPCDVVHLDPDWLRPWHNGDFEWNREAFPDPEGMIRRMHEHGFKLCLWVPAWIPLNTEIFETMAAKGFLVTNHAGELSCPVRQEDSLAAIRGKGIICGDWFPARGVVRPDVTNPAAIEFLKQRIRPLIEMGVDAFLTDQSEMVPDDEVYANGLSGRAMHNHFTTLFNKLFWEAFKDYAPDRGWVVIGRSGYVGSNQYAISMAGDQLSEYFSLPNVIWAALNAGMSGIAFCGDDIGGILGTRPPTPDLYIRWAQFGLLSSYARSHGTTPREPWEFGDAALRIFRELDAFRYRLIPYLYSYGIIAAKTGLPVMRPMVLEFQDDSLTHRLGLQYMLGRELLVAPIYDETGERDIYLPEGEWVHYWDKRRFRGPCALRWNAPLESVPLFVRPGAIIPFGPPVEYVGPQTSNPLTVEIYPCGDSSFTLYEEDGQIRFAVGAKNDGALTLSVEGDLAREYTFQIWMDVKPTGVRLGGKALPEAKDARSYGRHDAAWRHDSRKKVTQVKTTAASSLRIKIV